MAYNSTLIMTNTGMRTMEAGNLRWRDIDVRTDQHNRKFVCINVRGKGKFRELVAASNVASYLDRIKAISKATKADDFVFTTNAGKPAVNLYNSLIESLLTESGLLQSSSGSPAAPTVSATPTQPSASWKSLTYIFSPSKWELP